MKASFAVLAILLGVAGFCAADPASAGSANRALILVNGAPLYEESNKVLKAIDYLTLGDVVTLLNATGTYTENGKARDFTRIRALSAKEGWVRTQFIATKAMLGVVTADKSVIYSEPRDVKLTSRFVNGLTVVAVLPEGSSDTFDRVQGYDVGQGTLFTDSTYLSTTDVSTSSADVNAAILLNVAAATKDAVLKKNLLNIALKKYGQSVFLPKIQAGLGINPSAAPSPDDSAPPADQGQ